MQRTLPRRRFRDSARAYGRRPLRLEGPADTVADWRDEFIEIVKSTGRSTS
ncbi:MAG TPA: hypothetical protein VJB14_16320 [Planctomycetota bacterium]|nr:hypothetical protein [Planctomycetota bacterium]